MTISSESREVGPFTGNGSTTAFPFTFKVIAASDLSVVKTNATTGVSSTLTLTSDYTVTLNTDQNNNAGGTVTLLSALASGYTMMISTAAAYLQPTNLTNGGGFYPTVINDALDRLTIFVQQMLRTINRGIRIPSSESATSTNLILPIASLRANNYLAFDESGNVFSTPGTASTTPISTAMAPVVQAATTSAAAAAMGVLPLSGGTLTGSLIGTTFSGTSFSGAHNGSIGATTPSSGKFLYAYSPEITLTDAASIAWDASLGQVAKVTLGGSRTFAAPTNLQTGAMYSVFLIQDATGSRTVSWNTAFAFTGGTAPTLSTAANAVDQIAFRYDGTKLREIGRSLGTA